MATWILLLMFPNFYVKENKSMFFLNIHFNIKTNDAEELTEKKNVYKQADAGVVEIITRNCMLCHVTQKSIVLWRKSVLFWETKAPWPRSVCWPRYQELYSPCLYSLCLYFLRIHNVRNAFVSFLDCVLFLLFWKVDALSQDIPRL